MSELKRTDHITQQSIDRSRRSQDIEYTIGTLQQHLEISRANEQAWKKRALAAERKVDILESKLERKNNA